MVNKLTLKGPLQPKPFQNCGILSSTLQVAEFALKFLTDPKNRTDTPKKIPF